MGKKSPGSSGSGKDARSAVSGRFVTKNYAKSHPKTTVVETKPGGSPPGTKGASNKKKQPNTKSNER